MIAKSRARSFYLTNLTLGKCLLQNALKFYYKMQLVLFVTKRCKNVLQNAAAFLLQNASILLQNSASITKLNAAIVIS